MSTQSDQEYINQLRALFGEKPTEKPVVKDADHKEKLNALFKNASPIKPEEKSNLTINDLLPLPSDRLASEVITDQNVKQVMNAKVIRAKDKGHEKIVLNTKEYGILCSAMSVPELKKWKGIPILVDAYA